MRSNLSFGCVLAPNNRDRFVPLSCHCEPAKQSLFFLYAGCGKARSPRYARDDRKR